MIIITLIVIYLLIGILALRYTDNGGWLAMMSYNFPKMALFLCLPGVIILWPLTRFWEIRK